MPSVREKIFVNCDVRQGPVKCLVIHGHAAHQSKYRFFVWHGGSHSSYAIFSAHDELLGDEASLIAQQVVSDAGYNVLIDSKGVHHITSSTIKFIAKLINKE